MKETTEWKRLFEEEGVSPSEIAKVFEVPLPRVSEWLQRKRKSTAVIVMWTWEENGQKSFSLQRVHEGCLSSERPPTYENVKMYVGVGLWGYLNLIREKNSFINDQNAN